MQHSQLPALQPPQVGVHKRYKVKQLLFAYSLPGHPSQQ